MKFKDMVECMDKNCRTVVVSKHVDGLKCVRCGGPTRPMPFAPIKQKTEHDKSNGLTIQVTADTTEALERIKEVTEAANECAEALEKLEKVMGKFAKKNDVIKIDVPVLINGRKIAEGVTRIMETEREIASRTC
nr:hypothetical protein [Bacillus cereus]